MHRTTDNSCPGCDATGSTHKIEGAPYKTWKGRRKVRIPQYSYQCSKCGSVWSDEALIKENIAAIQKWAEENNKLVLDSDVRRIRMWLGISQKSAAKLYGCRQKDVYRWENNLASPPPMAEALLFLLKKHPKLAEELAEAKDLNLVIW